MKRELPEYMLPSTFVQLERFPLTSNGKIDRKALPFPSFEYAQASNEFVEPRTETEKALAAIWNNVLKVERIGIHDDFFDLGGHSLLVIRAVSQIRDLFAIDLSPRTFFTNPTISGLARALGEAQDSDGNVQRIGRFLSLKSESGFSTNSCRVVRPTTSWMSFGLRGYWPQMR
jgi:acyl carrier protein